MAGIQEFKIQLEQEFQHLPKAPIVEAVVNFRARVESSWQEEIIGPKLKAAMPEYPQAESQRGVLLTVQMNQADPRTPSPSSSSEDLGWMGVRFRSKDGLQIATFTRDEFSVSRLQPYENWNCLIREALRLWEIHLDIAKVTSVERLGVRFINRLEVPSAEFRLEDYFQNYKIGTLGFPLEGFFHHDVLLVPGYPYGINVIRTVQPTPSDQPGTPGLILDIDVFTREPLINPTLAIIEHRLTEMRWLKNHVFFNNVTKEALERCK